MTAQHNEVFPDIAAFNKQKKSKALLVSKLCSTRALLHTSSEQAAHNQVLPDCRSPKTIEQDLGEILRHGLGALHKGKYLQRHIVKTQTAR